MREIAMLYRVQRGMRRRGGRKHGTQLEEEDTGTQEFPYRGPQHNLGFSQHPAGGEQGKGEESEHGNPFLVQLLDVECRMSECVLVFELMRGGDLRRFLRMSNPYLEARQQEHGADALDPRSAAAKRRWDAFRLDAMHERVRRRASKRDSGTGQDVLWALEMHERAEAASALAGSRKRSREAAATAAAAAAAAATATGAGATVTHAKYDNVVGDERDNDKENGNEKYTALTDWVEPRSPAWVQKMMAQLVSAVNALHSMGIMHRDIKPGNLLLSRDFQTLKLGDLGLCRPIMAPRRLTRHVVTLWYRAPEILLGAKWYNAAIDIWSMGAVLAELATGHALFQGDSELGQLMETFEVLGKPSPAQWDEASHFPFWCDHWPEFEPKDLHTLLAPLGGEGVDMVRAMLQLNPARRPTAASCTQHPFVAEEMQNLSRRFGAHRVCPPLARPVAQGSDTSTICAKPSHVADDGVADSHNATAGDGEPDEASTERESMSTNLSSHASFTSTSDGTGPRLDSTETATSSLGYPMHVLRFDQTEGAGMAAHAPRKCPAGAPPGTLPIDLRASVSSSQQRQHSVSMDTTVSVSSITSLSSSSSSFSAASTVANIPTAPKDATIADGYPPFDDTTGSLDLDNLHKVGYGTACGEGVLGASYPETDAAAGSTSASISM